MKVLKDNQFNEIKEKAEKFDAIVAAMTENSEDIKAEDITAELIIEAMTPSEDGKDSSEVEELTTQINTLTTERDALQQRAETAEARVSELEALPAEETAGGKTPKKSDMAESSLDEVNTFAKSHANDQISVIEMVRKSGIV